ncbi:hypothetical protein AA313_de0201167 [Arthrobotrys entomopaga]|nr:hypothetical protein AA313_de0201167 [Arthrobotrys entomopaga]
MSSTRDLPPLTSNYWGRFWRSQHTKPPPFPKNINLTNQVAIVTGSNTGLGYEASRLFLNFKLSRLIMAVRSAERGEAAAQKLRTEFPNATINVWSLDMNSYDSITAFATRVNKELTRLDIAILNAGYNSQQFKKSPQGHEEMVQVNYLSTHLLAILLLPALKSKSPVGVPGRMTIVSSALANIAQLPDHKSVPLFTALDDPEKFGMPTYGVSKLLGHLWLWKLIEGGYVKSDDVVLNLIEPGYLKGTEFSRKVSGVTKVVLKLFQALVARTVQDGATTVIDASVIKGRESENCYLADWEIRPFPPFLHTKEGQDAADKLWEETMSEYKFANVQRILDSMKS